MRIASTATCLTVEDTNASSTFLTRHFGFQETMAADGFASLSHPDGPHVVFVRRGLEVLPEGLREQRAAGVLLAFTVADLPAEYERLRAEGVTILMEPRVEPWGERVFLVSDPNGVVVEIVDWVDTGTEADAGADIGAGA
ncbi:MULTISPECIES: VOC family protein [unclassified Streptomyces]|uniref:VOC family protein n=1 Tax=unclassified Streptomyces TaxID=2593676 RepID=UPI000DC75C3E|nr:MULTISPECIES: VOC family protein [unclassified Streptomyces]AWZ10444.1 glyoxalase [Streptomyces sp. ICC4]AWZ18146.1 glyoxalase [Streptomyces sp. ICC1]